MKNLTKKLFLLTSVMSIAVVMAGCSSSSSRNERNRDVDYVQTHEDDDVTRISARMFQRFGPVDSNGRGNRMGAIKFNETESGLKMFVVLNNVRPGVEYTLYVYDMVGCDKSNPQAGCEKKKLDISFPKVTGDAEGRIRARFMATGVTAAELNDAKITLNRPDANGKEIAVGWGVLKEKRWF